MKLFVILLTLFTYLDAFKVQATIIKNLLAMMQESLAFRSRPYNGKNVLPKAERKKKEEKKLKLAKLEADNKTKKNGEICN